MPSIEQWRVMNPDSPSGQAYSAVVLEGVSGQIVFSGHMRRAATQSSHAFLLQLLTGSVQLPPNAHRREMDPSKPGSQLFTKLSPSYTASHSPSEGHSRFGVHALAEGSSHTPCALQKRVCSPKKPVPQDSRAVVSAGVRGQDPSPSQ